MPPLVRALGEDFNRLHPAVRAHYAAASVEAEGEMEEIYVSGAVRPLARLSYAIFGAPVPRGGKNVPFTLRNRTDDSGAMHWDRVFAAGPLSPTPVRFRSRMFYAGDHRILELTRFGLGVESHVSVDDEGSLIYEVLRYVLTLPLLRRTARFPAWLAPFGGGTTREKGVDERSFSVDFEMRHPLLGRTVAYRGTCRIRSP